jgi:hypothetical protein
MRQRDKLGEIEAAIDPQKLRVSASRVVSQAQVIHNISVLRNF